MKVTRTEITRSNREVKENAHTPADMASLAFPSVVLPRVPELIVLGAVI
jgi:hypothetical protein